ncbi:MAG: cyclohydrolase [Clostridia bacterium]|nr:cyclohydrolase [Clostridia bacterium]
MDKEKLQKAVLMLIEAIGEDPNREGLLETPRRIADMYEEIFAGINHDPAKELTVVFDENHEEMVLVKDIPLYSVCEHHFLPFLGKAHVVYIPQGKITGLSKLARVVDMAARRPQVQERLTSQIADIIMKKLKPYGVVVVLEAEHLCMSMRGVKKPGSKTITSAVRGIFRHDQAARAEAMSLIRGH